MWGMAHFPVNVRQLILKGFVTSCAEAIERTENAAVALEKTGGWSGKGIRSLINRLAGIRKRCEGIVAFEHPSEECRRVVTELHKTGRVFHRWMMRSWSDWVEAEDAAVHVWGYPHASSSASVDSAVNFQYPSFHVPTRYDFWLLHLRCAKDAGTLKEALNDKKALESKVEEHANSWRINPGQNPWDESIEPRWKAGLLMLAEHLQDHAHPNNRRIIAGVSVDPQAVIEGINAELDAIVRPAPKASAPAEQPTGTTLLLPKPLRESPPVAPVVTAPESMFKNSEKTRGPKPKIREPLMNWIACRKFTIVSPTKPDRRTVCKQIAADLKAIRPLNVPKVGYSTIEEWSKRAEIRHLQSGNSWECSFVYPGFSGKLN